MDEREGGREGGREAQRGREGGRIASEASNERGYFAICEAISLTVMRCLPAETQRMFGAWIQL